MANILDINEEGGREITILRLSDAERAMSDVRDLLSSIDPACWSAKAVSAALTAALHIIEHQEWHLNDVGCDLRTGWGPGRNVTPSTGEAIRCAFNEPEV